MDANELEAALAHMKQMQNDQLTTPPRCGFRFFSFRVRCSTSDVVNNKKLRREEPPDFLAQLDTENRDVKTELSELQAINNKK